MSRDLWRRTAIAIQLFTFFGVSVSAQQSRATATTTLRVTADVRCIVAMDGRPLGIAGATPTVIRIPPGAHVFSASLGEEYYCERKIDVTAGTGALHVELIPIVREQMAHELAIVEAGKRARELESKTTAEKSAAEATRVEATEISAKAAGDQRLLLEHVQRVIAEIRELDRKFKAYSEAAEKQAQENSALRAEADRQNNGTAVGAIAGLLGNIAAMSGDGDARRNRLRATAALRRMDRLTAALSIASNQGF